MHIFYTWKKQNSTQFLNELLNKYFHITDYIIQKTTLGKKYIVLSNDKKPLEFSITHSKNFLAIAFHTCAVGIDSECIRAKYPESIFKKMSIAEQEECKTSYDFFKNWTAKESFVKLKGQSILDEFKALNYTKNRLTYSGKVVPCQIYFKELRYENDVYILAICTERKVDKIYFEEIKL